MNPGTDNIPPPHTRARARAHVVKIEHDPGTTQESIMGWSTWRMKQTKASRVNFRSDMLPPTPLTTVQMERPQYTTDDHRGLNNIVRESMQKPSGHFHKVTTYGSTNPPRTSSVNMRGSVISDHLTHANSQEG